MAKSSNSQGGLGETVKTIVYALLIAVVFRTLFFQPFWIPSSSMKDTLLIGDFVFVNKMAYGYSRHSCPFSICPFSGRILGGEPERGDVIVFRHPVNNTDYVKRLIGLPGDTVQLKEGIVYLNGKMLPQEGAGTFVELKAPQGPMQDRPSCGNDPVGEGGQCITDRRIETLPEGKRHNVLNLTDSDFPDNTDIYSVPEGQYFFMGDNRDNSIDSRFDPRAGGVGFVPAEYLIGRADRIMFSSAGRSLLFFWTWRSDRFFRAVE